MTATLFTTEDQKYTFITDSDITSPFQLKEGKDILLFLPSTSTDYELIRFLWDAGVGIYCENVMTGVKGYYRSSGCSKVIAQIPHGRHKPFKGVINVLDQSLLKSKEILHELVVLKDHKDNIGKDEFYEQKQPTLWAKAKKILKWKDTKK